MAQKCYDFFRHHKFDHCQTLHEDTSHRALPVHTTYSDLDHVSWSQQCQTVLTENFIILSDSFGSL